MRLEHMEASSASHVFEIPNYSQHRDLVVGSFLRSATFHAGGCAWSLRFYPGGASPSTAPHVAVGLELMTGDAVVSASYNVGLADDATGARYSAVDSDIAEFDTRCVEGFLRTWCVFEFMARSDLEASRFLRGDRIVIECSVRVIKVTRAVPDELHPSTVELMAPPPSELPEDMARLLKDGVASDVTFDVQGETFRAHRNILAVRMPTVFRTVLQRAPKDGFGMPRVLIHDMKPAVFKAVLHFVYTDRLPAGMEDDLGSNGGVEMAQELLAASMRFDMGRLKLVCEQILSKNLEVENLAATLVLANRYNCGGLKDACIEFMISSKMDDVARTEGYAVLKEEYPYLLVEAMEKAGKLGKI